MKKYRQIAKNKRHAKITQHASVNNKLFSKFHASLTFLCFNNRQNLRGRFGASKMHLSPKWLSLLSVLRRGSVVVDLLLYAPPISCDILCWSLF